MEAKVDVIVYQKGGKVFRTSYILPEVPLNFKEGIAYTYSNGLKGLEHEGVTILHTLTEK